LKKQLEISEFVAAVLHCIVASRVRLIFSGSKDKKAELSQRRPRDARNILVPWKVQESWLRTWLLFLQFLMGFLNFSDRYYTKNVRTKFEVRSSTRSWDNRGYWQNFGSPWIRPRSLCLPNF